MLKKQRSRPNVACNPVPRGYPVEPVCGGCGLKGLTIMRPGGFGIIRFYAITGGWREAPRYYCENCLEGHTGQNPYCG